MWYPLLFEIDTNMRSTRIRRLRAHSSDTDMCTLHTLFAFEERANSRRRDVDATVFRVGGDSRSSRRVSRTFFGHPYHRLHCHIASML